MPPDPPTQLHKAQIALGPPTENKEPPTAGSGYGLVQQESMACNNITTMCNPYPTSLMHGIFLQAIFSCCIYTALVSLILALPFLHTSINCFTLVAFAS